MDRNAAGSWRLVMNLVALRKESVDRNLLAAGSLIMIGGSLSARRAWIEIPDRSGPRWGRDRRSPQGERG